MTEKQLEKLGKILNLMSPSTEMNIDIYVHNISKKEAVEIMKGMPKGFRKTTRITESGNNWKEAIKSNVYGLGRLEVTVFYLKGKGGDKKC